MAFHLLAVEHTPESDTNLTDLTRGTLTASLFSNGFTGASLQGQQGHKS